MQTRKTIISTNRVLLIHHKWSPFSERRRLRVMHNLKERYKMKKYINPEIEVVELNSTDVITTSPGTEMPKYDEDDGIWEYSISNG